MADGHRTGVDAVELEDAIAVRADDVGGDIDMRVQREPAAVDLVHDRRGNSELVDAVRLDEVIRIVLHRLARDADEGVPDSACPQRLVDVHAADTGYRTVQTEGTGGTAAKSTRCYRGRGGGRAAQGEQSPSADVDGHLSLSVSVDLAGRIWQSRAERNDLCHRC